MVESIAFFDCWLIKALFDYEKFKYTYTETRLEYTKEN